MIKQHAISNLYFFEFLNNTKTVTIIKISRKVSYCEMNKNITRIGAHVDDVRVRNYRIF